MVMGTQPLVSVVALNCNRCGGGSVVAWCYLPTDHLGKCSARKGGRGWLSGHFYILLAGKTALLPVTTMDICRALYALRCFGIGKLVLGEAQII